MAGCAVAKPAAPPVIASASTVPATKPVSGWPVRALSTYTKDEAAFLKPMPVKPTLMDFLELRIPLTQHLTRAAMWAIKQRHTDAVVAACLLHDVGEALMRTDHGFWAEQMIRPYVTEEIAWASRNHQILRFYADPAAGYKGPPALYEKLFGKGYVPDPYIQHAYHEARSHKWYMTSRLVTIADQETPSQRQLYSGAETFAPVDPRELTDVIGRVFKQPADGLGYDGSPVAHMWRALIHPTRPL
jgi:hypothetical protein